MVHGIPTDYRLQDGDLLSVDCGAFLEGWCGDAAVSFIVGTADPVDQAHLRAQLATLRAAVTSKGGVPAASGPGKFQQGRDFVNGAMGNDRIYGGAGRDWLRGGPGADRISGGSGSDRISHG